MNDLADKVAIVTGSSRGIGAAIAVELASRGAAVVVNYAARRDAADAVVASVSAAGGRAVAVQADLMELSDIPKLISAATDAFGGLDILVNNAGTADLGKPLADITPESYDRQFDLNVRGLLFATQAAAGVMRDGGRIVHITSGITRTPSPGCSVYSATKAAVEMLTKVWARELGARQITVNAVAPGTTDTDLLWSAMPREAAEGLMKSTPLGRLGTPTDIAKVVAFLCSPDAGWITGEILGATGGL